MAKQTVTATPPQFSYKGIKGIEKLIGDAHNQKLSGAMAQMAGQDDSPFHVQFDTDWEAIIELFKKAGKLPPSYKYQPGTLAINPSLQLVRILQ